MAVVEKFSGGGLMSRVDYHSEASHFIPIFKFVM